MFRLIKTYLIIAVCSISTISCGGSDSEDDPKPTPPVIEAGLPVFYITGNKTDKVTAHQQGIVLAGGGTDNDSAMKWMLQRAKGGDVVVLRASGSNGYNDYFFSSLATSLNSVTTIVIDTRDKAQKDSVYNTIRRAEVLFIAGGDQLAYIDNWKDTKVSQAIDYLINTKKVTIGGTSAGMAVLSQICYSAGGSTQGNLTSTAALADAGGDNITLVKDFMKIPMLASVVTDTHFSERDRMGRLVTFMARAATDLNLKMRGIACDENTAVCVDEQGNAKVFGNKAFFLKQQNEAPEVCEKGRPLTWNRSNKAILCDEIQGSNSPSVKFDINTWTSTDAKQYYLSLTDGVLNKTVKN